MASSPRSDGRTSSVAVGRAWWLEDAVPGVTLRHPGARTITDAEHVWLAWVTHNVSDVHGDRHLAARSAWGQPLVLGMLTAAIVMGLAEPGLRLSGTAVAGLPDGWRSIALRRPVVAGDTIRAESLIEAVEVQPGALTGWIRRTISGMDQRDERVAVIVEERSVPRCP